MTADLKWVNGYRCGFCNQWRDTTKIDGHDERLCGQCAADVLNIELNSAVTQLAITEDAFRAAGDAVKRIKGENTQ